MTLETAEKTDAPKNVVKLTVRGAGDPDGFARSAESVDKLASMIKARLTTYPYFVVLSGFPRSENAYLPHAIVQNIAGRAPVTAALDGHGRPKVSFTKVKIEEQPPRRNASVTYFSRTNQRIELHTDSSYRSSPEELVAFHMVRSDRAGGGETLLATAEDVAKTLDQRVMDVLRRSRFPFGQDSHPILTGDLKIRFYRKQIEMAGADRQAFAAEEIRALDTLDAALSDERAHFRHRLESGETLFLNNRRILHGRTGFGEDSDRLMLRFRVNAGCLV